MEINESSLLIWDFNENDELVQITFDDYCAKENILAYEEKETLIQRLTSNIYSQKSDSLCSICFEEEERCERCKLPVCGHSFHVKCISKWLFKVFSCPVCRQQMPLV